MPLFERLIDLDLIELHSLQFGADAEQIAPWRHRQEIHEWNNRLNDFSDTAHLLSQLDLVITVDTAVAHLAGALNKPTWVLLPQNADFRWLRQRSDSPWYPSMRLFRQQAHGDWQSVVDQLDEAFDPCFCLTPRLWLQRGCPDDQPHADLFLSLRLLLWCSGWSCCLSWFVVSRRN